MSLPLLPLIASDPMHQFRIVELIPIHIGGLTLSFTNSSLFMLVAVTGLCLFLGIIAAHAQIRPGRLQLIAESVYQFVAGIVRDGMGNEGMRFFPLVFSLFVFIFTANMIGMFPYFFTTTSHIIVNFALAMLVMSVLILYGFWRNGLRFLKIFAPSGIPLAIMPLIILIEIISFISRPISLSLRLFANMLAGHIMLKVFAGFVITLGGAGGLLILAAPLPLAMTIALTALEFLVSFLQAYVFAVLTCIYLNDALHPEH